MKFVYELEIKGSLEKGGGYIGADTGFNEAIRLAQRDIGQVKVLIQEGASEPRPIKATIRVKAFHLVLEEGDK